MLEKEKAHATGGAAAQAGETAVFGDTTISIANSIIAQTETQGRIAALLGHGEENAITTAELVNLAGLRSPRELRAEIEKERAAGSLILSTVRHRGGYYLPSPDPVQGRAEIEAFIRTVHTRALNSQRTLKAARRALRQCVGQTEVKA